MIPLLIDFHTRAQMKFIFQAASCTADWGRGGKRTKILTESGGGAGGACRFSRFRCRLALQSTILHTLQYAVGVQAAAGLVPTERLVPPYDVKPTQCHFNFSSLITLGPYNLTARTQIKAVENNLGGTF